MYAYGFQLFILSEWIEIEGQGGDRDRIVLEEKGDITHPAADNAIHLLVLAQLILSIWKQLRGLLVVQELDHLIHG